jgi:aryl-alcohol dehydrogenase-like predicted oxidoreductase
MRGVAEGRGCTVAQVALAWLLAQESVTSILLGATKLHQLEENLGVVDVRLTPEDLTALDAATALPRGRPTGTDPDEILAKALGGE